MVCLYKHIMPVTAITTEPEIKTLITAGHHQVPEVTPEVMVKKVFKLELFKHNLELLFEGFQLCFNANSVHVYQFPPFMVEY